MVDWKKHVETKEWNYEAICDKVVGRKISIFLDMVKHTRELIYEIICLQDSNIKIGLPIILNPRWFSTGSDGSYTDPPVSPTEIPPWTNKTPTVNQLMSAKMRLKRIHEISMDTIDGLV